MAESLAEHHAASGYPTVQEEGDPEVPQRVARYQDQASGAGLRLRALGLHADC